MISLLNIVPRVVVGLDQDSMTMYVCILDATGHVLVHRNVPTTPAAFLDVAGPYRADLAVAAECMFTWYWLAAIPATPTPPTSPSAGWWSDA